MARKGIKGIKNNPILKHNPCKKIKDLQGCGKERDLSDLKQSLS